MPEPIVMPVMSEAQEASWHALMDLYDDIPEQWTLVGGQLVHLWCADRGANVTRPTDDIDAVLDVRAKPRILLQVTQALTDRGFTAETSQNGVQHRWRRGEAVVDVLIPRHLGPRASRYTGAAGGRTIETPGAQKVLNRTGTALVRVGDRVGTILRPTLVGAIIGKSAAYTVELDRDRDRHLGDLVTLASLLRPSDTRAGAGLDNRERRLVSNAIGAARTKPDTWSFVPGGRVALDRLARALLRPGRAQSHQPPPHVP